MRLSTRTRTALSVHPWLQYCRQGLGNRPLPLPRLADSFRNIAAATSSPHPVRVGRRIISTDTGDTADTLQGLLCEPSPYSFRNLPAVFSQFCDLMSIPVSLIPAIWFRFPPAGPPISAASAWSKTPRKPSGAICLYAGGTAILKGRAHGL